MAAAVQNPLQVSGYWPPQLANDPVMQQIAAAWTQKYNQPGAIGVGSTGVQAARNDFLSQVNARMQQLGYKPPPGQAIGMGGLGPKGSAWEFLIPAAIFLGGLALAPALGGSAAATAAPATGSAVGTAATAAPATGSAVGTGTVATSGAGAGTAAAAGAGTAAATSPGWLPPVISAAGKAITSAAQGEQAANAANANYGLNYENTGINASTATNAATNAALAQRSTLANLEDQYANQAVRGGALEGVQDVSITPPSNVHMATITGGLRPSAIVDKAAIGDALKRQAMLDLLNPEQPSAVVPYGSPQTTNPNQLPNLVTPPPLPNFNAPGSAPYLAALGLGLNTAATLPFLRNPSQGLPVNVMPTGD